MALKLVAGNRIHGFADKIKAEFAIAQFHLEMRSSLWRSFRPSNYFLNLQSP